MLTSLGAVKSLIRMVQWAPNLDCRTWAMAALALLAYDESGMCRRSLLIGISMLGR